MERHEKGDNQKAEKNRSGGQKLFRGLLAVCRVLPFALVVGCVIWYFLYGGDIGVEDVLSFTPNNLVMAALALILLYAVKSLSVVFPLLVLYISAGMVFPVPAALAVNLAGIFVCVAIPYLVGKYSGRELVARLEKRYKAIARMEHFKKNNEFFCAFFLRVINMLPGDIVSIVLGASNMRFSRYAAGSVLGLLPTMVAATFMGESILEPLSPVFLTSAGATVLISAGSFVLWKITSKKI